MVSQTDAIVASGHASNHSKHREGVELSPGTCWAISDTRFEFRINESSFLRPEYVLDAPSMREGVQKFVTRPLILYLGSPTRI
jgi:hypothetical protein